MAILRLASVLLLLNCLPHFFVQTVDADSCLSIRGLISPVFSTFDSRGNLNLKIIPKYAKYLKRNGVDGVVVAGTTGEVTRLSKNEKKKLISAWVRVGRSVGLKVIAQVGGVPLPIVVELAQYSQNVGVDGILTLPELYYRPRTPQELVYFLKIIGNAAPKVPLLYYHTPEYTHVNVNLRETFDLASKQIPSFAGMKINVFEDALPLRTRMNCKKVLFIAETANLAPAVLVGFRDYILGQLNIFPKLISDIVGEGKGEACRVKNVIDLNEKLQSYVRAINKDLKHPIPALKQAMRLVTGINVGKVRPPGLPLTKDQIEDLSDNLEDAGLDIDD